MKVTGVNIAKNCDIRWPTVLDTSQPHYTYIPNFSGEFTLTYFSSRIDPCPYPDSQTTLKALSNGVDLGSLPEFQVSATQESIVISIDTESQLSTGFFTIQIQEIDEIGSSGSYN